MADYIDREDAIDAIHKTLLPTLGDEDGEPFDNVERFVLTLSKIVTNAIKAMPSATVREVKRGKWVCSDDSFECAVCSVCKFDGGELYGYAREHWHFCPNCGAEMRGGDDETD